MKGSGLFPVLSILLFVFASISSAWPWPGSPNHNIDALILQRQDSTSTDTDSAAATTTESAAATTSASTSGTITSAAESAASESKNATKTTSSKSTSIDARLPPGGIEMITPAATDGVQYYKVGDYITFKWNYTSLSVTPTAIDVLASCSLNDATYTITGNMSVEATGALTWDTGNFAGANTQPFPVASYTLVVYDAASEVTDVASAGYLAAYDQYIFGMYTGQPYTPLNEFKCATCSGALSIHEKQAFGVLLMTAAITVMSFTWFARGFGAFS
ncbi:hypothetical protein EDD37DRAFT_329739 [Exophiala viscosa]|uniref:uncharacterized protein n=1 Tax=Exophiala viscosa TaxID=2486360 RepID=UPI0021977306|nr:hypothetical protein EDD37DRAFT_329739 [Exophiala viscosa]